MKNIIYRLFLYGIILLYIGQKANAQQTLSDFKVEGATSVSVYQNLSTNRVASFSLKMTRPAFGQGSADNYVPTIRLVGGYASESIVSGLSINNYSWAYNPANNNSVATVTGTFFLNYPDAAQGIHTALRADLTCCGSSPARSNLVTINAKSNSNDAVTITSFTIDNARTLTISPTVKTVTYVLGLSKDAGYADEFSITLRGNYGFSNMFSAPVLGATRQTSSSAWTTPANSVKRVCTITQSFQISTADVNSYDIYLAAVATSPRGEVLTLTPHTSSTQVTSIPLTQTAPPCVSDVYVQNTSSLTGITSAGRSLYAGRAVTGSANGDVVIRSGQNVTFIARESIDLQGGFSAVDGATFSAYLDAAVCSSARIAQEDVPQESVVYEPPSDENYSANGIERSESGNRRTISAYPNPATEIILLPQNTQHAMLLDGQGQVLRQSKDSEALNVKELPEGLYNLQMWQEGKIINQRIEIRH